MAKATEIFVAFADKAEQLPNLFPENSKSGANTHAAPAIWQKPDEFKATIAKFANDVKNAQANSKDLASFKTSFGAVGANCRGCHETFRTKMN
jgi:cytochrome c556